MFLKGIFADKSAVFQLMILLLLVLFGSIFSSLLVVTPFYLFYGMQADLMQHPNLMRLIQLFSAIGTFLLPALVFAWTCSYHPKDFLSIGRFPNVHLLLLTFLSMVLLSPAINLIGLFNRQMDLPDCLAPLENWMLAQEEAAEQVTQLLLSGEGAITLCANLIVIALAAGITEEFLFRGALQRVFEKWTPNHHLVIWITSILFSTFHLQFYGFIPRMLLGAYFGYLLYWSRNLWVPIFAHFTNNAIAVLSMSDESLKENEYITGEITAPHLFPYTVIAIILFILFLFCCQTIKRSALKTLSSSK